MSKQKIIAFDLDDVLCTRDKKHEILGARKYEHCVPIHEYVNLLNRLYDEGHEIVIYTARGMTQFAGDVDTIEHNLRALTETQLNNWGVRYHRLVFGKQHYEVLIDDKALNSIGLTYQSVKSFLE